MNESSESPQGLADGLVDAYKLAKRQDVRQGTIDPSSMQRLNKLLASNVGQITYRLEFRIEDELCVIVGEFDGWLTLRCQRCVKPFKYVVGKKTFSVSPVATDAEAKNLPKDYEPVLMYNGRVDVHELVEDELILALPIVAMHDRGSVNCKQDAETEYVQQEAEHPFSVLQTLKLNKNEPTGRG